MVSQWSYLSLKLRKTLGSLTPTSVPFNVMGERPLADEEEVLEDAQAV